VKGIVPSREIDYPLKNSFRYKFFYNTIASHIIVNSEATKQTVLKSAPWLDPERVTVIYKGISAEPYSDLPASNIKEELRLEASTKLVSFVGQLDERKGLHFLLEAWKIVAFKHSDAVLLLMGKGPMKGYIDDFVQQHHLQSSVLLLGFRNDIPAILQQSYLLALPSLWEGFGYVLVEAMAARIPTVATATSSIPEIVVHNETGFLVPPKDSEALGKALHDLLQKPDVARTLGENGRKRMEKMFTIDMMLDKFEEVFRKSIS
jgi:glycosyltransferase involved in cell wall biosynthesis